MKKYNIAFIPKSKADEFISLSKLKEKKELTYMLGEGSLPHVTVCQFYLEEDNLEETWREICTNSSYETISLTFKKYSHITFGNDIYWLSLIPEESEELNEIFDYVLKTVTPIRKDKYDPHLTLFNYLKKENPSELVENFIVHQDINIADEFELIIGECDKVGQLTSIVSRFENQGLRLCFS
jgi:2'-5' RNA ligase